MIIAVAGGGSLGAIYGIGSLITYFNTGADPAAALNIHPNIPPDWPVEVEWMSDDVDTGRELAPFDRTKIESAYVRAWLQMGFSYTKGEPHGLKTYFAGPALAMVEENLAAYATSDQIVSQVATSHQLQLHFYSADGTLAAFTDREARVAHHVTDRDGNEILAVEDVAAYQVIMVVDEGNWKVRHWLRRDIGDYGLPREADPEEEAPAEPLVTVDSNSGQLMLSGEPYEIRGINYYPQVNTWLDSWEAYDGQVIDQDFALINTMGLNTVRIFVPYELFGRDEALEDEYDLYIQRLRDMLNIAWANDLRVIVTLFDFKPDYGLLTWPKTDRHLEALLTTFKRHPAILAWDIKNEPDLDYDHAGEGLVNIWLEHIIASARRYDPYHLVTIGWSSPEAAVTLADQVDFVSYHYYGWADAFPAKYQALRTAVGAEKALVLGEFGLPTWNSYLFPNGHTEEEQANYYAAIMGSLQERDSAGFLAWTLYDFEHVPSIVVGRLPWRRGPQKHMGVIREDGSFKPAAQFLLPNATFAEPYQITSVDRFTKPFFVTIAAGGILTILSLFMLGAWFLWKRNGPPTG